MKVITYDPFVSAEEAAVLGAYKVELDELLSRSDCISIHCPLTPETRGMFNYEAFKAMKDSACLINTARGPIIDEPDLVKALDEGITGGAGLDVLMDDHGGADNPLFTPHAAWYSEESILCRRTQTVESVMGVLQGREPVSFVNRDNIQVPLAS